MNQEPYTPLVYNFTSAHEVPDNVKEMAKNKHIQFLRQKRNDLLAETDKFFLPDFPNMDETKITELKQYRQQLRDYMSHTNIVNYDGFNSEQIPDFPLKPSFV